MLVHNPTKKNVAIWWGHTPYIIGPGATENIPDSVVKDCLKHNDYAMLQIVNADNKPIVEAAPVAVEPVTSAPQYPWDDLNWNPELAPYTELEQFASVHGMVWDADNLENNRALIMERLLEME